MVEQLNEENYISTKTMLPYYPNLKKMSKI